MINSPPNVYYTVKAENLECMDDGLMASPPTVAKSVVAKVQQSEPLPPLSPDQPPVADAPSTPSDVPGDKQGTPPSVSAKEATATATATAPPFAVGDSVELQGIASDPSFNGKCGSIEGMKEDRYVIRLDDRETVVMVREANLKHKAAAVAEAPVAAAAPAPPAPQFHENDVVVVQDKDAPQQNRVGVVERVDAGSLVVRFDNATMSVVPADVVLVPSVSKDGVEETPAAAAAPNGSPKAEDRVELQGLSNDPTFNGRAGVVKDVKADGRVVVALDGDTLVLVKPDNVRVVAASAPVSATTMAVVPAAVPVLAKGTAVVLQGSGVVAGYAGRQGVVELAVDKTVVVRLDKDTVVAVGADQVTALEPPPAGDKFASGMKEAFEGIWAGLMKRMREDSAAGTDTKLAVAKGATGVSLEDVAAKAMAQLETVRQAIGHGVDEAKAKLAMDEVRATLAARMDSLADQLVDYKARVGANLGDLERKMGFQR